MAYADVAYAIEVYGEAYVITSCDRDLDGDLDTTAFERALARATNRINSNIAGRVDADRLAAFMADPATAPEILRTICVDLAIGDCSVTADTATEIKTKRTERAERDLRDIREGKIRLVQDDTAPAPEAVEPLKATLETERRRSVYIECGARTFTRTRMSGL